MKWILNLLIKQVKNKYMKKIILSALVCCLIFLMTSCHSDQKYRIRDNRGNSYYTNKYILIDGCVSFLEKDKSDSTIICGNIGITNNPNYINN